MRAPYNKLVPRGDYYFEKIETEVKAAMSNIAEGIDTTAAAYKLASKLGLKVPIINLIYGVLFESLPPMEITNRFKSGLKPEANI